VILVTGLLILNITLTLRNNRILAENGSLQKQAEEVKVSISQFAIVIIHNLDLGLRSYALYRKEKYLFPLQFALRDKDSIMSVVEKTLLSHQYPMKEFYLLRDSINAYASFCSRMLQLFRDNEMAEFYRLSDLDKGYHLWLQYEHFEREAYRFENKINEAARRRYDAAMENDYMIQVLLLLLTAPTLVITAIHTNRKFSFEVKLRQLEEEKAMLLSSQNKMLEEIVAQRTGEIEAQNRILQTQNEEISAQNEEIKVQNEELNTHREALARQNESLVETKRLQLELYTQNLMEKSEMISRIGDELNQFKNRLASDSEQIQKYDSILHFNIVTDDDWEKFKKTFHEVYPNFFASLRYRFPPITASELRLSALIKMNLSLKEAANMLGISNDSVKKSRYRLKKRLGLLDEDSLEEFIGNLV